MAFGRVTPFDDPRARFEAGRFGMWLFLASVGMLFAASLVGFLVLRLTSDRWPADLPGLPGTLWLSTAVLLASSGTLAWGQRAVRRGDATTLRTALGATLTLALVFLTLQAVSWWLWRRDLAALVDAGAQRFALSGFYVLTGVHALHVIGGLVPLGIVAGRAVRPGDDAQRQAGVRYGSGVRLCAMYWHFLDAVWIVLFGTLLVGL